MVMSLWDVEDAEESPMLLVMFTEEATVIVCPWWRRTRRVGWASSSVERSVRSVFAAPGRSALLMTSTSAISKIPALMAWISSPNPGASTTTVVCARRAMSTSLCPAPTVSTMMISYPAASKIWVNEAVIRASPPTEPREAIERMKTPSSPERSRIRTRSPSTAPPVNGLDGSTAMMATVFFWSLR